MTPEGPTGWWQGALAEGHTDYAFAIDGGPARPDPRSPWQPRGVHGPSRSVDHAAFAWTDDDWPGRAVAGGVIYELHVGTFTPAGTFAAAIERLDHLVDLGVDFVEVMPVNAFPGTRGWGYDGVALYAVHDPYGGPDGLRSFVDACHARGLGVLLDVVYNHLGPDGNYLPEFGPYFTDKHQTPWGPAVNLDDDHAPEVRAFFIDNAVQWLRDYHVDGLRLDAIHAFVDESPTHFLAELADRVERLADEVGRPLSLIAESDLNDPRVIQPRDDNGHGMHAQWSDDFHHALHAVLTEEQDGYYADFGRIADVAAALTQGFVFTGQHSEYRGTPHGAPLPDSISGHQLLGYLQDHDQIGNRARGDRISTLAPTGLLYVGAALVLTSPFTPMLFMGEEWGAATPWQYFTDHENAELANAVREGRRAEFAGFGWRPEDVPDPQDIATFERSRLNWAEIETSPHRELLEWHRSLIQLRNDWPDLSNGDLTSVDVAYDEGARWIAVRRGQVQVLCNLAAHAQHVPMSLSGDGEVRVLLSSVQPTPQADGQLLLAAHSVVIGLG
jgi:maltooligosyltrehalose trehalohydrolase